MQIVAKPVLVYQLSITYSTCITYLESFQYGFMVRLGWYSTEVNKINGRQMVPAGKSGGSQTNLSAENLKLIKNDFITNQ